MSAETKLLVVEDEPDILTVVLKHLRKNGFEPTGFTDPLKARDEFKSDPTKYLVVLTDIRMPGINGIDLANEIQSINPQTKIILMSAFEVHAQDLELKLPLVTYEDIIRKPFKLVEICNRVKQLTKAN